MSAQRPLSRRTFLQASGLAALGATTAAACGTGGGPDGAAAGPTAGPETTFQEPSRKLSGSLRILMWSHFVPSHDDWFDRFAKDWGKRVGVDVEVNHLSVADIPARITSEIAAGQGHDLIQYIATLSQFEPSVVDMADVTREANRRHGDQLPLCTRSSRNPKTGKFYAFAPGWVPDPGNYRASMWRAAGMGQGPSSWQELLEGGSRLKSDRGVQLGIGMSQEIDSNMAGRALLWSFGAAVQDENENVVINSPETVAAVEFMTRLYRQAMTPEVFSWEASSNNESLIAGRLSYILNSISAYRKAQEARPDVAADVSLVPALQGPRAALAAQHVMYNWIVPEFSGNADAAQEFLLHYTANFASATYHSQLYDFPAWPGLVPKLDGWLSNDPFGAQPADKLAVLKGATDWATNIGHPGPASPAVGEIFSTYVIPNMFARAARGDMSPEQTVKRAESEIGPIFAKWRKRGLVAGG